MTIARDVAMALGLTLAALIGYTVLRVARDRPRQPKRSRKMPPYYRTPGRLRAAVMSDNRRRGRRTRKGR